MLRRKDPRTAAREPGLVAATRALGFATVALASSWPASAGTNQFTLIGPDGGFIRQVLVRLKPDPRRRA